MLVHRLIRFFDYLDYVRLMLAVLAGSNRMHHGTKLNSLCSLLISSSALKTSVTYRVYTQEMFAYLCDDSWHWAMLLAQYSVAALATSDLKASFI